MNFIIFDYSNGTNLFQWEKDVTQFPENVISFSYYYQDQFDVNGHITVSQYMIGVPVKFIIGDMYIKLESFDLDDDSLNGVYCLYDRNGQQNFVPLTSNMQLVKTEEELKQKFFEEVKKNALAKSK